LYIFFYIIFLRLYKSGIQALSPWNHKAKLWLDGRKNILDTVKALGLNDKGPLVWMHCASIGEFEQGRPVVEKIRSHYPGVKILITFYSPTGYELKKNYEGADYTLYLPSDSKKNAKAFIAAVAPTLVLWVKHEYWYFYLTELKNRNIPTLLISANFRQEQPFFHWYGKIYCLMLDCFTHIFVQTEKASHLVSALVPKEKISVNGDTRFDRVIEIAEQRDAMPSIERFCGLHPVIVAGSTWEEDEEEISHYANAHSEIRFLIAPCFIEEEQLKDAERLFRKSIRYSVLLQQIDNQTFKDTNAPNVLLIDQMGILSALYRFGHITYVGGGFGDDGVHNVLEAAVYGRPVVMGPVIEKYVEAMELVELGGAIVIDSALEAEAVFNRLFENPEEYQHRCDACKNYVYSKRGATDRIIQFIQEKRLLTN
jgi:3-deoxy-D-manno-octulosonic-acid transferase